jgi:tetratricopeptide (TPR) repeat protein
MNSQKVLVGTFIWIAAASQVSLRAQDTEKRDEPQEVAEPHKPLSSLLDSIRTAYRQTRDNDVLALVDQAFLEVTKSGDHAKDAELYFWRGSAYRRLGKQEQALTSLEQARVLGYRHAELYLESGLAHKSLGQTQEADNDYLEGQKYLPEDFTQRERYNERWQHEGKEPTRVQLWITPSIGFDSNVVGLDPNTPLFQNIKHFDSFYEGVYLDAKWYLVRSDHQVLYLEYQGQGRQYPSSNELSYFDNLTSLTGRTPLTYWADVEVRGAWEEAFVNTDGHFRTERTGGAAVILQPVSDVQMRIWGDFTNVSYYDPTLPEQNRDGTISRIGITVPIDLHRDWSVSPFFIFNKYDALGSDYKSRGWEGGATVISPVYAGFKFALTASYSAQDYLNPNSITNFTENRRDRPFSVILAITFKQLESIIGYAPMISVSYYKHESNIAAFNYSRWAPQVELGINVLNF